MTIRWNRLVVCLVLTMLAACSNSGGNGPKLDNGVNKVYTESKPIALFNCLIIDGTGAQPLTGAIILIKDGLIADVLDQSGTIPEEYEKIDLQGRTVLPGFINAHVHNAHQKSQLEKWASSGVTTVRDLNPRLDNFVEVRDELNANLHNARVVASSPMITVNRGYGSAYVSTAQEAREITQRYIDAGADLIKFSLEDSLAGQSYPMLSSEQVNAITSTARENKMRTSVHVSHIWNLQLAVEAGVSDLAHMVVEPLCEQGVQQIVDNGIYWVPTLELWRGVSDRHQIFWDHVAMANLKMFYEAGGLIALGTDFGGYSTPFDDGFPITEVRMMKQAGMSNMDIIIAGTKNAAHVCHREDQLGTIEPGKIADLLIIEGNPLEDIENLAKTSMVFRNGVLVYSR